MTPFSLLPSLFAYDFSQRNKYILVDLSPTNRLSFSTTRGKKSKRTHMVCISNNRQCMCILWMRVIDRRISPASAEILMDNPSDALSACEARSLALVHSIRTLFAVSFVRSGSTRGIRVQEIRFSWPLEADVTHSDIRWALQMFSDRFVTMKHVQASRECRQSL